MRSKNARNEECAARQVFRVAHASRVLAMTSRRRGLFGKTVSARRRNQHARRVRYPELLPNTCDGTVGRDSIEPGRIGRSAERHPIVQYAGIMGPVFQQHAHPANRPTSHPQDETVLLFRSIPFSNSADRKFRAPLSAIPEKSKSQRCG